MVSCYTLLSGCRLPWPPSICLYEPTHFLVRFKSVFKLLTSFSWFIPNRQYCLPVLAH